MDLTSLWETARDHVPFLAMAAPAAATTRPYYTRLFESAAIALGGGLVAMYAAQIKSATEIAGLSSRMAEIQTRMEALQQGGGVLTRELQVSVRDLDRRVTRIEDRPEAGRPK